MNENKYGSYHMIDNSNFEPQRTNNFEVQIIDLDTLDHAGKTFSGISSSIKLAVDKHSIPKFTVSVLKIKRGNTQVKYAGTPEYGSGSMTLNDYIGLEVAGKIAAWQNLVYDPETEEVGLATSYKKRIILREMSPSYEIIRKWEIIGAFPTSVDLGDFNNSDNSVRKITVALEYDYARLVYES